MTEKELAVYVGKRIREERNKKKMTQKELGRRIGVKHNTVSSYESGTNAPEQNAIFKIARALEVAVDECFPPKEGPKDELERELKMKKNLNKKHMEFLNKQIEKTLSLDEEEREKFLESIRFTVEYYESMKD